MKIVGSLLFLSTHSRPDISFHVNYLSLFMKSATIRQLHLAKRVLQNIGYSKTYHLLQVYNVSLMLSITRLSYLKRATTLPLITHPSNCYLAGRPIQRLESVHHNLIANITIKLRCILSIPLLSFDFDSIG